MIIALATPRVASSVEEALARTRPYGSMRREA